MERKVYYRTETLIPEFIRNGEYESSAGESKQLGIGNDYDTNRSLVSSRRNRARKGCFRHGQRHTLLELLAVNQSSESDFPRVLSGWKGPPAPNLRWHSASTASRMPENTDSTPHHAWEPRGIQIRPTFVSLETVSHTRHGRITARTQGTEWVHAKLNRPCSFSVLK